MANLPFNIDRPTPSKTVGWDASGHLWKIHKEGPVWFAQVRDGIACRHGKTLKALSAKLAGTTTRNINGIMEVVSE